MIDVNRHENPDDPLNGPGYRTGEPCIAPGCDAPAGTHWSPFWCVRHNAERMNRISENLTRIGRGDEV